MEKQFKHCKKLNIIEQNKLMPKIIKLKYGLKNNKKEHNIKRISLKKNNEKVLSILFQKKCIGNIKFEKINFKRSCCYFKIVFNDKKWQHTDFHSEIIQTACNQIFNKHEISKVFVNVKSKDKKNLNHYFKNGFIIKKKINSENYIMYRNYFLNKIVLGTAQLNSNYGLTNKKGGISIKDLKKIKKLSLKRGMVTVETAQAYKGSEKILGDIDFSKFNIISKIETINNKKIVNLKDFINKSVKNSLTKLNLKKIYAFLFHNSEDLFSKNGKRIFKNLYELKKKGKITNIGVAVYNVDELKILDKHFDFDIVTIPFNILDKRFEKSNIVKKLKKKNVKFYARSIFLQGLLLMKVKNLPNFFIKWKKIFKKLEDFSSKNKFSKLQLCLNHALNSKIIDKVIVGVDNLSHFYQVANLCKKNNKIFLPSFGKVDYRLINPQKWKIR